MRVKKHADVHRFVSLLNVRRLLRDVEHERRRVSLNTMIQQASKAWHGVRLLQPDWGDDSHSVAFGGELWKEGLLFHLMRNAYWERLELGLPKLGGRPWRRWIDTALDSRDDMVRWEQALPLKSPTYKVGDRSVVVLFTSHKE